MRSLALSFELLTGPCPSPEPIENPDNEDTFDFFSPKLLRDVMVVGRHRFEYAMLCEFDQDVHSYTERPGPPLNGVVDGKPKTYQPAFWVRRQSRRELLYAVEMHDKLEFDSESNGPRPKDWGIVRAIRNQTSSEIELVLDTELDLRRRLLNNCQQALPLVTRVCLEKNLSLLTSVFDKFQSDGAFTLSEVTAAFLKDEPEAVFGTVLYLIQRGVWSANFAEGRIGRNLIVRPEPSNPLWQQMSSDEQSGVRT